MLSELRDFYEKNGILSTKFTCRYKQQCAANCREFTGPKSAFVSTGYERGDLPRLLFLSLDSGSGEKIDECRLPVAVRQQEEIDRVFSNLHKGKHWYRTHELAWHILKRFDPTITLDEIRGYFAHANAAKCCMNNPQNKKANATLFRNCQGYIGEELAILRPQIIVTQGNEARAAIASVRPNLLRRIDEFASEIEIDSQKMFWLHTYHPRNWGSFHRQRSDNGTTDIAAGWEKYANFIGAFVRGI